MRKRLLVFPHCPKNAGTTLRERYKDNSNFCIRDYRPANENDDVIFGHVVKIGEYETLFPDREIVYCTTLRDPVERLISQYNFFNTQLKYMFPDTNPVDFKLWFINKDIIRPMIFAKQYEYYLYNNVDVYKWFNNKILLDPSKNNILYNNTSLHWDGVSTSINYELIRELNNKKSTVEKHNSDFTYKNVMTKFDHILLTGKNVVNEFDDIIEHYGFDMQPNDIERTNETKVSLNEKFNLPYIKLIDLSAEDRELINEDMHWDIQFYNRICDSIC
jgi:hypothetical protein